MNNVAIIGAGASGLTAAITLAKAGIEVDIYEHNTKPAKKILASGNGRCNISNRSVSISDYYGQKVEFAEFALKNFTFSHLEKFCKEMGLILNILDDGRAYPLSNEAKSVAVIFETFALSCGVNIITEQKISKVEKRNNLFYLYNEGLSSKPYEKLLIATGSEAAPQLGATAKGYEFAKSFGHTIIPTYPALVQLHLNSNIHKKMAGCKQEAKTTLYVNGYIEKTVEGDILFTKYGISGFAVLDISTIASKALLSNQDVTISLDLLPKFQIQALASQILSMCKNLKNYTIEDLLYGLLPIKIAQNILYAMKIEPHCLTKNISSKTAKQIAYKIKDWRFEVNDTHGFAHAEASGGGICTDEINEKSMESKLCKGVFFAGEVLDIVGKRGGYNFHFAFATAFLAASSMKKKG